MASVKEDLEADEPLRQTTALLQVPSLLKLPSTPCRAVPQGPLIGMAVSMSTHQVYVLGRVLVAA